MTTGHFMTLAVAICLMTQPRSGYSQPDWKIYVDKEAGYSITYPGFLSQIPWNELHPEADQESIYQWRTKTFHSKDRAVTLYLEFHPVTKPESLGQFFNEKMKNRATGGDHIGYVLTKDNWYVISGVNSQGYEFYASTRNSFYLLPQPVKTRTGISTSILFTRTISIKSTIHSLQGSRATLYPTCQVITTTDRGGI